jgi:hypothetical protein
MRIPVGREPAIPLIPDSLDFAVHPQRQTKSCERRNHDAGIASNVAPEIKGSNRQK